MSRPRRFKTLGPHAPESGWPSKNETLSDSQFLHRFLEPTMWQVLDLPTTAWWGHLPFMMAVVDLVRPRRFAELGTHFGASFFAANQAAQRIGTEMEACAVDSWEGDIHAGDYGETVYEGFLEVLEHRSYSNAVPLRMFFDEAAELFEPNSVDLLHIDGLHTYEAVLHDYNTWIDTVVPGGLILFHDINVHEKDFGVWRLWEELTNEAPPGRTFAFHHSHGLGVLQTNGEGFPQLTRLLQLLNDRADLASFTQLVVGRIGEVGHAASKLGPTAKALSAHRDAIAEHGANRKIQAERQKVQDAHHRRRDRELAQVREQLLETERRYAEVLQDERKRYVELSKLRNGLQDNLSKTQTLQRLAVSRAAAVEERLQKQLHQALVEVNADVLSRSLDVLHRAAGKVAGEPTSSTGAARARAIAKRVELQLFADELADSGLFDEAFYTKTYPETAAHTEGPLMHFVHQGRFEDRRPNEFFNPSTYRTLNPDVANAGVEPIEHYLRFGSFEFREVGEAFDGPGYLLANTDVVESGANPLGHFLRVGRDQGRSPLPQTSGTSSLDVPTETFDWNLDRATTIELFESYESQSDEIDKLMVSIVMPAFNRADVLPEAVASIQAQSHQNWELIIVDDGSSDDSAAVAERLSRDPRVQVILNGHHGVSHARNSALDVARGDYVAFLDTDNVWTPDYLRLMLMFFTNTGSHSAYSALVMVNDDGRETGFLSSQFDWDACLSNNFIDMNVFMHRRDAVGADGAPVRFETRLKRLVDWDYILRLTREQPAAHATFVGCRYLNSTSRTDRITKSQPLIYRQIVRQRNNPSVENPPSFAEISANLVLEFAIRVGIPWRDRHRSPHAQYAIELQRELGDLGHTARLVFEDDDEVSESAIEEVNVVIRGNLLHGPVPNGLNVLWVISNPETVSTEEMAGYHLVYVASESHAALVQHDPEVEPRVLLPATRFTQSDSDRCGGLVFVGDAGHVERPLVDWAIDGGAELRLYGSGWHGTAAADQWHGAALSDESLPALYAGADAVLINHPESRRDFGYISDQVFDVLASGGSVISDPMPAIDRLFGSSVSQVASQGDLAAAVQRGTPTQPDENATSVSTDHSFGARARQIVNDVFAYLSLDQPYGVEIGGSEPWGQHDSELTEPRSAPRTPHSLTNPGPLRVGAVLPRSSLGYEISAYVRVLSPLTTEENFSRSQLVALTDPTRSNVSGLDAVIVSERALGDLAAASELVGLANNAGTSLLVDLQESALTRPGGPSDQLDASRLEALQYLLEKADAVTVSTEKVAEEMGLAAGARTHVVPTTLDSRWWRHRRTDEQLRKDTTQPLRLLAMGSSVLGGSAIGSSAQGDELNLLIDLLDVWAPNNNVQLSVVGAPENVATPSWISHVDLPPNVGNYPRLAHWLSTQPHFDIGLIGIPDLASNVGSSELGFLQCCAMRAVPVLSSCDWLSTHSHESGLAYCSPGSTDLWLEALSAAVDEVRRGTRADERWDWLWTHRDANQAGRQLNEILAELGRNTSS